MMQLRSIGADPVEAQQRYENRQCRIKGMAVICVFAHGSPRPH